VNISESSEERGPRRAEVERASGHEGENYRPLDAHTTFATCEELEAFHNGAEQAKKPLPTQVHTRRGSTARTPLTYAPVELSQVSAVWQR
jgi:hypothetical protein